MFYLPVARYGRKGKMPKYTPFRQWLKRHPQDNVVVTFSEIEKIIDEHLPLVRENILDGGIIHKAPWQFTLYLTLAFRQ